MILENKHAKEFREKQDLLRMHSTQTPKNKSNFLNVPFGELMDE